MKFTCRQENLEKGLSQVYKAVPNKANLPILSNIHIAAEGGRLCLSATNLDTSITVFVGVSVEEDGRTTVPAKLFRDFISNLPEGIITLSMEKNLLVIEAGHNKAKLNTTPADDYPEIPHMEDGQEVLEIDSAVFSDAVKSVVFAAATDESRPVFSGVLLSFVDGVFSVVASDGFRLSERVLGLETDFGATFSVVVPAKTLLEVARLVSLEEPTKICMDSRSNLVLFQNKDIVIATRILEGQFPDYKRIIPTEHTLEAEILFSDILEAVRLADVFSQQVDGSITITFDPEGFIRVASSSPESGEHSSSFSALVEGSGLDIVLNSKYILDFLSNIPSEKIKIRTQNSLSPCVLCPLDKDDFVHIIMPRQSRD